MTRTNERLVGGDLVSVTLAEHGEFTTSVETVARVERSSKRELAQMITDAYGGGCGRASTKTYWLAYPKAILAVVYGGLVEPKDGVRHARERARVAAFGPATYPVDDRMIAAPVESYHARRAYELMLKPAERVAYAAIYESGGTCPGCGGTISLYESDVVRHVRLDCDEVK